MPVVSVIFIPVKWQCYKDKLSKHGWDLYFRDGICGSFMAAEFLGSIHFKDSFKRLALYSLLVTKFSQISVF